MKKTDKYTPECPFCGRVVSRPQETRTEFGNVLCGKCVCGAVFVCDPTGRNVGEAYMEALVLMKGDWELGELDPERDYAVEEMDYDLRSHIRVYGKGLTQTAGKLVFVRGSAAGTLATETPTPVKAPADAGETRTEREGTMKSKKEIRDLLGRNDLAQIVSRAAENKAVLSALISLTYDKQDPRTWRAIEAIGLVAERFLEGRRSVLRETIRRLLWMMTDESGGIGWCAPEILGEIIRSDPDDFSDIVPIVWSYRDEELFAAGSLRAMGRIAEVRPDLAAFILPELPTFLGNPDPQVRGLAVWVFGILADGAALTALESLRNDTAVLKIYRGGELAETTVAELAANALNKQCK